jgi:hypothetical protein
MEFKGKTSIIEPIRGGETISYDKTILLNKKLGE